MKTKKAYVISKAVALFSNRGPKSVTMDEVALLVGISKRTLYEIFATKELLIEAVTRNMIEKNQQFIRICTSMSPNALIEINNLFTHLNKLVLSNTPIFLHELKKYYPNVYQLLDNSNSSLLGSFVENNIARGIREGIYRSEVGIEGMGGHYCWQLKKVTEDCTFRTEEIQEFLLFIHSFFIHGILNPKGFKLLTAVDNLPVGIKKMK